MSASIFKVKTSSGWSLVLSCIMFKGARALDALANLATNFMGSGYPGRFVPPKRPGLLVIEMIVLKGLTRWKTEEGTYFSFGISDCQMSSNVPTSKHSSFPYLRAVKKTKVWWPSRSLVLVCTAFNALGRASGASSICSWNTRVAIVPLAQILQRAGWVVSRRHTRRLHNVHTGPSSSTYVWWCYGIKQGKS